jgi:uncharacterized protein (TIGR00369 family)
MTLADQVQKQLGSFFPDTLGVRLLDVTEERVVAEMDVRDDLCTVPGIMHGGAIMAFADTLGAVGTSVNLPKGAGTTTIESKTNFFAPARSGETIRGECTPFHRGKRTMSWQTRVTGPDGKLIAVIAQTQMVLEPRLTPEQSLAAMFQGLPIEEQKALLARLERSGAALYRAFAEQEPDAAAREVLLQAARREEENAEVLEG